jgi:hypothetical protein
VIAGHDDHLDTSRLPLAVELRKRLHPVKASSPLQNVLLVVPLVFEESRKTFRRGVKNALAIARMLA